VVDLKDYFSDQAINLFHSLAIYLQTTATLDTADPFALFLQKTDERPTKGYSPEPPGYRQFENSRAENHSQWFMGIEFWE
jgi:hypothetical protein